MDRPAFFAFYPADFANDITVETMSTLQVGAYILLLCKAWQSDPPASLPADDAVLARLARVELAVWSEIKAGVLAAFKPGTDGRLHNKRLRQEFDTANKLIRERRKAGQAGAAGRWKNGKRNAVAMANALPSQCDGNAIQSQKEEEKTLVPSELTAVAADASSSEGVIPPIPPAKKPRKEPSGLHHDTVRAFCGRWQRKYGAKYPFDEGKDGAAVKWLLTRVENDTAKLGAVFDRFFADDDPFHAADGRHSLPKLRQHFARWLVDAPPPPRKSTQSRGAAADQYAADVLHNAGGTQSVSDF